MLILGGLPACGKDTVRAILVKQYNMLPVVRYTTRGMRENEVDGEAYHFISKKRFLAMREEGRFVEYEEFKTALSTDVLYYGSTPEDYGDNSITIISPTGISMLKNSPVKDDVFVALLYVPEYEVRNRLVERKWSDEEIERRIPFDKERYNNINQYVNCVIPCYTSAYPPERVAEIVYRWYQSELKKKNSKSSILEGDL